MGVGSFSIDLAVPNRLEEVVGLEPNKELVDVEGAFPNMEPAWPVAAEVDGANLMGVVVGFQV